MGRVRVTHYKSQRELFENEWFPKANAIGISWQEFWTLNPHIIKCLYKGYQEKLREQLMIQDRMAHAAGQYTLSAVTVAIDHALNEKKAKSKYIENPVLAQAIEDSMLTQEEIDEREMKKELLAMEQWIANDRQRGLPETKIR